MVYNKRNHILTFHNQTTISRLLCECELYSPANYDSDPEMKRVMQQFVDRTTQRFHEYDERMKTTRQKCKEQCDKEIQKIILKDKLEKQMVEQFSTLQTDIQSDAIPTCICEKSIADKMEKGCLRCGGVFGGIAPSVGLLGGIGEAAISAWKVAALKAATEYALTEGAAKGAIAGNAHGMNIVIYHLKELLIDKLVPDICKKVSSTGDYTHVINFVEIIIKKRQTMCGAGATTLDPNTCKEIAYKLGTKLRNGKQGLPDGLAVPKVLNGLVSQADQAANEVAKNTAKEVAAQITEQQTAAINATYTSWQIAITASVIAIVVIVLIMVIIYLILRYRRKKKMKKKLQYIKLLEE
ncbi:rifin [Plasmodium falciparum IGH-CR14]|uniref:Rifin n=1 Tax=Plasmodium falciparum IGH-CR14 TaxID=580059 RepID=A0A0L1I3I9_PLAFA|nr:rifin [Plasmodium falciparum IGH-CR14]